MPAGSKVWTMARTRSTSCERHAELLRDVEQRGVEIAGLVDLIDDPLGDRPDRRRTAPRPPGGGDDRGARRRRRRRLSKSGPSSEPPPPDPPMPRPPSRPRIASAALSWWKSSLFEIDVERALAAAGVGLGQRRRPRNRSPSRLRARAPPRARASPRRAGFEQRVLLELLGDEALDLEVGQREQADRLLQLRRHHQRLGLSKVEAGPQRHRSTARSSRPDRGGGHSRRRPDPRGCRRTAPGRHR